MYKGIIIGKSVEIIGSSDPSLVGRSGLIIDESKNTIMLEEDHGKVIRVPKSIVRLSIASEGWNQKSILVTESDLRAAPEERIKG